MEQNEKSNTTDNMDFKFTPAQREYMDTKMALALLEDLYSEGMINEKTIKGIRKNAGKRLEKLAERC